MLTAFLTEPHEATLRTILRCLAAVLRADKVRGAQHESAITPHIVRIWVIMSPGDPNVFPQVQKVLVALASETILLRILVGVNLTGKVCSAIMCSLLLAFPPVQMFKGSAVIMCPGIVMQPDMLVAMLPRPQ